MTHPFDGRGIVRDERGVQHYADLPESVVAMLHASVQRDPDGEALVELGGPRLTYAQLWERASEVAGGLRTAGVQRGDRIALRRPNGVDWVCAFFGILLNGSVAVPVNTRFTDGEAAYLVVDSESAYVLEVGRDLPDGEPYVEPGLGLGDLAAIFYTSGTTGFPKGALLSHENFLSNVQTVLRCVGMPEHDPQLRTLVSLPLFHVTGCNSQLLPTLYQGGTVVVMPTFDVKAFLEAIERERITAVTSVPSVFWRAIHLPTFGDHDLSGVRHVTYGGAPISADLVRAVKTAFPRARIGNGFGLTETASLSTYLPHEYAESHPDSVGFAAPVVELDLLEPHPDTGVGELLVRGANVVSGYWDNADATALALQDGWLRTGDLARIDDEGLTYVVDRTKDMINRGGENVYSVEVENALSAAPGVLEVAVVGVPDAVLGERVGAVVVPVPGGRLDVPAFLAHAREHLADYKVPERLAVRDRPLPRNRGGRVRKGELRESVQWEPFG